MKSKEVSPQFEYWLNRILRDHGKQIFILLFLILIAILVIFSGYFYSLTKEQPRLGPVINFENYNYNETNVSSDGQTIKSQQRDDQNSSTSSSTIIIKKNGQIIYEQGGSANQ